LDRSTVLDKLNAGERVEAIALARRLLQQDPENADLLGLLGVALEEAGEQAGAQEALNRALALPTAEAVKLRNASNLAGLLLKAGEKDAAAELLRRGWRWTCERAPDANERSCLAFLAVAMQRLALHEETLALMLPVIQQVAPDWPMLKAAVAALAELERPDEALRLLSQHDPDDAVAHERDALRAYLCNATGRFLRADRARAAYLETAPPFIARAREGQTLTIGVIENRPPQQRLLQPWPKAYLQDNYPPQLLQFCAERYRIAAIFLDAGSEPVRKFKSWQPDVIINNVTNAEVLLSGGNLDAAKAFAAQLAPRVINPPERAVLCTRQMNANHLARIEGLLVPNVRRFRRDVSRLDALVATIERATAYPMIVRTPHNQEAQNMKLATTRAELEDAIRAMPSAQFYVIEYKGQPREKGYFRRIRAAFVSGRPIIIRADYADDWAVRSRFVISTQVYQDHPDLLHKADAIVRDPHEHLGARAMQALEAVGKRISLDIFGMDFDVDEDGNVIFFEANATMGLMTPAPEPFPYPPEATERLTTALDRLFHDFAGGGAPSPDQDPNRIAEEVGKKALVRPVM
jgi:tetratricopeptide (TPR) repeat protein